VPTLTRAERRGALIVLALFALGAAHDLWRLARPVAPAGDPRRPAFAARGSFAAAGDNAGTAVSAPAAPAVADRVDLNQADAAGLDALPGIGPVIAGRILERRARQGPFRTPEDLLAVRGIGPAVFARLRDRVRVGPDSATVHSAARR
jgi:competence protein ComEA